MIRELTRRADAPRPPIAETELQLLAQTAAYVKQLATGGVAKVVSSEEGDLFGMTFSPDGNYPYYAYRPHGQPQAAIYVLPSLGGTPRLVINNASSGPGFSPWSAPRIYSRCRKTSSHCC